MISVNQGIGTCVPEKLEKGGLMMFYINGQGGGGGWLPLNGRGVKKIKGRLTPWKTL